MPIARIARFGAAAVLGLAGAAASAQTQGVDENSATPEAAPAPAADAKPVEPEDKEPFVGSERIQIARPSVDYQLARALDLLRGLSLLQKQAAN